MNKEKVSIFYAGYYGFDNFGDEAILYSTRLIIDKVCAKYNLDINHILLDTYYHTGFYSINRWKFLHVLNAIGKCDIVVFGGGGVFQDRTSSLSLYYYMFIVLFAKLMRKRIVLLGQGFISIGKSFNRFIVKWLLKDVAMTVRDKESRNFIDPLNNKNILSSDLLFNYPFSNFEDSNDSPAIYINLRAWENNAEKNSLLKIVKALMDETKTEKIALSLNPIDRKSLKIVEETLGVSYSQIVELEKSPNEFIKYYRKPAFLVGMRLHSLILATCFGIPFIAMSNDGKLERFALETGQQYFAPSDYDGIMVGIKNIKKHRKKYLAAINTAYDAMKKRAFLNESVFEEQLNIRRKI